MEYLTEGMEPSRALRFFEEICAIPHGSGNESALARYIIRIAGERGLEAETDRYGNVLVRIASGTGAEKAPFFLMQAHMDMVCEKEEWCGLDMDKEPVRLRRDGNIMYAEGSTLGADNAVGLCNMLAVMTDDTLKRPPMEFLFTVREETGLEGIRLFDMAKLKSRRMLTMDCGDPDTLILGSAGMLSFDIKMELAEAPLTREEVCRSFRISGLHGGHTGLEIGSGYADALSILAEVLVELETKFAVRLCELQVSGGAGSIPDGGRAVIAVPESADSDIKSRIADIMDDFRDEFSFTEKNISWDYAPDEKSMSQPCSLKKTAEMTCGTEMVPVKALNAKSTERLLDFLLSAPVGALKRHHLNPRQVLGSALIKCAELKAGVFTGIYAIRSNTEPYKYMLERKFSRLCSKYGIEFKKTGDDPAWPEKPLSSLTKLCIETYENRFGCKPHCELVHGGEEASIVAHRIPEMEIVGIAPYSRGAHTPKERLYLDTMLPVWQFLTDLLERLSEEE